MYAQDSMFTFCREVGLLKENFTVEGGLDAIKKHLSAKDDVDPDFLEAVKKLTVADVRKYVGIIYRYDIELDWYKGGNKYHNNINNFGNAGVPEALHITEYYKEGNYTVLKKASDCKLQIWNQNNVFSYEEIKNALKHVIEEKLPNGWTKYSSTSWTVSGYFVPLFCIKIPFDGKEYNLNYNLHNGRFNYHYPYPRSSLKTAKSYKKIAPIFNIIPWVISVIGALCVILTFKEFGKDWLRIVIILGTFALDYFWHIPKKSESDYRKLIQKAKNPFVKCFMPALIKIIVVFVIMLVGLFIAL